LWIGFKFAVREASCENPVVSCSVDRLLYRFVQNPNDISYVFSGYAPLGVRLAHILHRPGWRSITEVLNILPGRTIDEVKQNPPSWMRKRRELIIFVS
jgi:hypothetical protein